MKYNGCLLKFNKPSSEIIFYFKSNKVGISIDLSKSEDAKWDWGNENKDYDTLANIIGSTCLVQW